MKTSFVRLSALLVTLFFLASPVPLPAQEHATAKFDIAGFKLGSHGGPGLKEEVEALPEGYKCLDIMDADEDGKLAGYSCFAPVAPEDPFAPKARIGSEANKHLFFLFNGHGKVRLIHERVRPAETALLEEQYDALVEKYGEPSNSQPGGPPTTMNGVWGPVWAFDGSGEKIDDFNYKDLGLGKTVYASVGLYNSNLTGLNIPLKFSENQGVVFSAFLVPGPAEGGEPTVLSYDFTLFESQ
jgi:hypothetical protein